MSPDADESEPHALRRAFAFIEFTPDGVITEVNERFLSVMGYTRDEVLGKHHRMFVPADLAASEDYRSFWRSLREGEAHCAQVRRVARDGSERWLSGSYVPLTDAEGRVVKVIKFASDVTDTHRRVAECDAEQERTRTQAERELTALRRAFATIEFAPDGTIVDANDEFLRVMGYTRDEVVGKHHRMFAPPGYADTKEYARFWEGLRAGRSHTAEIHRVAKGGLDRWLQGAYVPFADETGRVTRVLKLASDVTQTHLAADQAATLGLWELNLVNGDLAHPQNHYWCSPQYARLLGWKEYDLFPQDVASITAMVHPDDNARVGEALVGAMSNRTAAFEFEYRHRCHDGQYRWFRSRGTARRGPGGVVLGFSGAIQDIHDEKETLLAIESLIARALTGDLTQRIDATARAGAMQVISGRLNELLDTLAESIRNVKDATSQVAQTATQLSATSRDMSHSATRITEGTTQVTTAVGEVTVGVEANARSAADANRLVVQTADAARAGDTRMAEMNSAMEAIHGSANEIAKIIQVIESIAIQTNLLALNAAVEAARAGRHGRGFAVVAQEVRKLAERSAEAAKETGTLIAASVSRVGEGVRIAQSTREALTEITRNVERVVDLVGEVTQASGEQTRSLGDIAALMIDSQRNADDASAQAAEVAAASAQLERQMRVLESQMARYTLPAIAHATGHALEGLSPELLEQIAAMLRSDATLLARLANTAAPLAQSA